MSGDRIEIVASGFHVHPVIEADGGFHVATVFGASNGGVPSVCTYRMASPGDCRRSRKPDRAG